MNEYSNVLIVGAGQLGSRHLQGAALVKSKINLIVVDRSMQSLHLSKERYSQMDFNPSVISINYFQDLNEVTQKNIDLVIIATSADVRADLIEKLTNNFSVKCMVLEKILFQRESDYGRIAKLLKQNQIDAWVNHPRRMFNFYTNLKLFLANKKIVRINVSGGQWGLACNGLHFIDLISFLASCKNLHLNDVDAGTQITNSKREGFIELIGGIGGYLDKIQFTLNSDKSDADLIVEINTVDMDIVINESKGEIKKINKITGIVEVEMKDILFNQSEISGVLIDSILSDSRCSLPKYDEVFMHHLFFIKKVMEYVNQKTRSVYNFCPIT